MITLIENLPDHVVGVIGSGKINDHDYKTVFIPALEEALKKHRKINVLYVLGRDYAGFTAGAMWDDTKEGFLHLKSWGRVAVVCDSSLMRGMSKALGFILPLSVRTYNPEEIEIAKDWVCGKDPA